MSDTTCSVCLAEFEIIPNNIEAEKLAPMYCPYCSFEISEFEETEYDGEDDEDIETEWE